jgi:hypothetical protein
MMIYFTTLTAGSLPRTVTSPSEWWNSKARLNISGYGRPMAIATSQIGSGDAHHTSLTLERHGQVMGALEAFNGMLFGLTTARSIPHYPEVWGLLGSRAH